MEKKKSLAPPATQTPKPPAW